MARSTESGTGHGGNASCLQQPGSKFDIIFTSAGVLAWLPDLTRWAAVIAHFLTPGGVFYIREF